MTELITKLIQRQTLSAGRINLKQRHCYDTAIESQTTRLMQRLELPEKWMRRYTGGVLKPDAIARRFNLRRVELAEWGQLVDVKVLPGKLQATTQFPPSTSPSVSAPDSLSASNSAFTLTAPEIAMATRPVSSRSPSLEAMATRPVSSRSPSLEKSDVLSSSSASPGLNPPPASPEATFRIRRGGSHSSAIASRSAAPQDEKNHSGRNGFRAHPMPDSGQQRIASTGIMPYPMRDAGPAQGIASTGSMPYPIQDSGQPQGIVPAGSMPHLMRDAGQQGIAPTRSTTEFKHVSRLDKNSVATTESHAPSLVLARVVRTTGKATPSSSEALPLPSVKAASQQNSAIVTSSTQTLAAMASEGRLVLPVKGKLSQSQETPEAPNSFLPIALKARAERSQLTSTQPQAASPELITVKPQSRLVTTPTPPDLSLPLPLLPRPNHSVPQATSDGSAVVSLPVANQTHQVSSMAPAAPVEPINIDRVAEEVSRLLSRRLMLERERRGIRP